MSPIDRSCVVGYNKQTCSGGIAPDIDRAHEDSHLVYRILRTSCLLACSLCYRVVSLMASGSAEAALAPMLVLGSVRMP